MQETANKSDHNKHWSMMGRFNKWRSKVERHPLQTTFKTVHSVIVDCGKMHNKLWEKVHYNVHFIVFMRTTTVNSTLTKGLPLSQTRNATMLGILHNLSKYTIENELFKFCRIIISSVRSNFQIIPLVCVLSTIRSTYILKRK